MDRLHALTPLVEQLSIDEAFLDVTAQAAPAEQIARHLQTTINKELSLPCSLGVAANKLVAKIANNLGKAAVRSGSPPNAITVVPPGQEAAFLAPLPCEELWGVGPKTATRLRELGMATIGDIARWPETELASRFGKNGRDLSQHAKGIDHRPVEPHRDTKSISQETTFTRDVRDGDQLRRVLAEQAEGVSKELKRKRLTATTVKLKLRWSDFTTLTRQSSFPQPLDDGEQIRLAAIRLFDQEWQGQLVRLIGVGVTGLSNTARQLSLWDAPNEREERLWQTLEALRKRFGDGAISLGKALTDADRPE
jgi:DNA polymerase-4